MAGKAILTDPIMIEWVRLPRMIDRLIAHLAEGTTELDASGRPSGAVSGCVTGVRGILATGHASLLVPIGASWEISHRIAPASLK
jgi:hypothetical protein